MCHQGRDRGVQGARLEKKFFFIFFYFYFFARWSSVEEVFIFFLFFFFLQGGRLGEKVAGLQGGSVGPDHLQARLAKLHKAMFM